MNTPGGLAAFDRLTFTARAEHPMRISVQIRVAVKPSEDERWQRSVYIDTVDGERTVYLDDLTPIGDTRTYRPPLADVHSIVFAIDMTNTKPGDVWAPVDQERGASEVERSTFSVRRSTFTCST